MIIAVWLVKGTLVSVQEELKLRRPELIPGNAFSWSLTAIAIDKFMHIIDPTKAPVKVRAFPRSLTLADSASGSHHALHLADQSPRQRALPPQLRTRRRLLLCSSVRCTFAFIPFSFRNATPFCGHFCDETNWQGEHSRRVYGTMVMLLQVLPLLPKRKLQFVIPMGIITYCYSRILNKVSRDMIIQNAQFSQSLTMKQRLDAIHRKRKVSSSLRALTLAGELHPHSHGVHLHRLLAPSHSRQPRQRLQSVL